MTNEELAAIRARAEAATPGPWLVDADFGLASAPGIVPAGFPKTHKRPIVGNSETRGGVWDDDATFIAHAREDIPALMAEIDRLRDRMAALNAMLSAAGLPKFFRDDL